MSTPLIVCGAAGRMGRAILGVIAQTENASVLGAVERPGHPDLGRDAGAVSGLGQIGVAITADLASLLRPEAVVLDFTGPEAALSNLKAAADKGAGIVIGTTGFTAAQQAEVDGLARRARCVISANMSAGIAVLHKLLAGAAQALGGEFDIEIVEMHHRLKVDAPSGTALALARTATEATSRSMEKDLRYGREGIVGKRTDREIGVLALRGGDVVGDHTVIFAGPGERIELTHRAQSRDCLARGAVRAALWVSDKTKGRYDMNDVLGLR